MENKENEVNHNVYLSFDGKDSCVSSFISYLNLAFERQGIYAFLDGKNNDHDEAAEIESESERFCNLRAFVVVFSKTFHKSILEKYNKHPCCDNDDFVVVPVFYGISIASVKEHIKNLGALQRLMMKWPHGHEYDAKRSEYEFQEDIARDVFEKLYPTEEIGIYERQLEIENLLCKQPWAIYTLGICGKHGIGKTTLVRAIFRRICSDYDASCFNKDFQTGYNGMGPKSLSLEYLSETPMETFGQSSSDSEPTYRKKRVIVVLDDVQKVQSAKSFLGGFDKFGRGSLIIITSRDRKVLEQCQMNEIYELKGLNDKDALKLVTRYAYGKDVIEENHLEYLPMIKRFDGNPLALRKYAEELKGHAMADMGPLLPNVSTVFMNSQELSCGEVEKQTDTHISYETDHETQPNKGFSSDGDDVQANLDTKTILVPSSELYTERKSRSQTQKNPRFGHYCNRISKSLRVYRLDYLSFESLYKHLNRLWLRFSKSQDDVNQLEHRLQVLLHRSGGSIVIRRLLQLVQTYKQGNPKTSLVL
ncbi:protein DA1-related 4-like [Capsella rubella]|uniref:protein DA1-related 4-like n=1 Tax=Capsella rubella TaxID=81985 RepID=UPI000CD5ACD0|nr:protein DA1-related 4-like [Capsella rubella]